MTHNEVEAESGGRDTARVLERNANLQRSIYSSSGQWPRKKLYYRPVSELQL